jgi:site-specific DNA-methyltransferase (adenine-specific)
MIKCDCGCEFEPVIEYRHRLLCGDSTKREDVERVMQGEKIEAIVADPPYGIGYSPGGGGGGIRRKDGTRYEKRFTGKDLVIGDDKPFDPSCLIAYGVPTILWGGSHYASRLPDSTSWLVWDKRRGTSTNDFADAEIAWTNLGKPVRVFSHLWNGMLKDSERGDVRIHPTQKPVAVIEWCLGYIEDGLIILDPFAGSGTTLVACQNLQRKCRAIEISPNYCAVILERMATAFPDIVIERIET